MYKPRFFTKLIPSITVTVLLLNLLAPVGLAFAQDGSPPADPPPTEEVAADEQPVEQEAAEEEPAEEVVEDDTSSLEETQPMEEPFAEDQSQEDSGSELAGAAGTDEEQAETEETGAADAALEEPGDETSSLEEEVTTEEASDETASLEEEAAAVAEAVQALDEADAVLLDENGEPLSMASQEAADALAAPDPQFCPAGLAFGDAGCSASHTNMADAIADALTAAAANISGTIFVEAGSFSGFTLDGFTYGTSLTIQGNADVAGTTSFTGTSIFGSGGANSFSQLNIYDVTFDNGLQINNTNASDGIELNNVVGDVAFDTVDVSNSTRDGILVQNHDGAVSLNNVTANNTGDDGAEIDNMASSTDAAVTVTNSTFNNNVNDDGLEINSDGAVTITNVTANGNGENGVQVVNETSLSDAAVTITNVTVEQNANDGLHVDSAGTITLNNVNANNNDDDGAELHNFFTDAAVNVFNSNFDGNGATAVVGTGLEILSFGMVTIDNVSASNNTGSNDFNLGAFIDNTGLGNDAAVNITNSVFNGNIGVLDGTGLEIYSDGQITLNGVQANNNQATDPAGQAWGLYTENYGTGSGLSISNSSFNGNVGPDGSFGIEAFSDGQITLNNVNANQNGDTSSAITIGALLDNSCACSGEGVTITDSTFNGNFAEGYVAGLLVRSGGSITLNNVAANGNTSTSGFAGGALLTNGLGAGGSDVDASVSVSSSSFFNNVGPTNGIGLLVYSQGNITLSHVSANGNSVDGVDLQIDSTGPQNTSIYCSSMQNNGDTGIYVDGQGGDLKIQSTDTSGNGVTPLVIVNVNNTIFGQTNCDPGSGVNDRDDGKHAPLDPKDPTTIVLDLYPHSVTFPPMNLLECSGYVKSLFYASELPAELYAGDDFLRAMKIRIEGCDIPDGGMFTIGFDIPAAEQVNEFAILFWDGATWVEVPGQLTEDGRYTGTWPTTGIFVLVTR